MGAHVASRLRFRSRVRPSSSAYSRVCSPRTIVLKLKAARALLATVQIPTAAETPVSYLNHVLQPGETVRYQGSVHWILYLPPIFLSVIGAVAAFTGPVGLIVATVCFAVALVVALRAWFIRWTTEIAVTNLRVIYAQGFIQRRSVEVHMDKIESVDVDQSVLGRLFNYGNVTIHGTGTTLEPFRGIDRPIEFRNQVTAT